MQPASKLSNFQYNLNHNLSSLRYNLRQNLQPGILLKSLFVTTFVFTGLTYPYTFQINSIGKSFPVMAQVSLESDTIKVNNSGGEEKKPTLEELQLQVDQLTSQPTSDNGSPVLDSLGQQFTTLKELKFVEPPKPKPKEVKKEVVKEVKPEENKVAEVKEVKAEPASVVVSDNPNPSPAELKAMIIAGCGEFGCDARFLFDTMWCESTGINHKTTYHKGYFQFLPSTFSANAARIGIKNPDVFNPGQQVRVAAYMFSKGQAGQWPVCSAKSRAFGVTTSPWNKL
jgi:hypothetical protein